MDADKPGGLVVEIKVPAEIGTGVTAARVTEWLKAEGDRVAVTEPLLVIETEKASLEVEAGFDGHLLRLCVTIGDLVEPGQVIALVETT